MRRLLPLLALAVALAVPAPAAATPVKCAASDSTPDDRVFPEPQLTATFLRFDEFQCGVKLLESQYPDLIEVKVLGTSKAGHPLYDVELTDEKVTAKKEKLLVVSSIHGNEVGGREGGAHVIEDMVDPRLKAGEPWVQKVLDEYVIHMVFPNPDGWVAGDIAGSEGAGFMASRGNDSGRDLNRQFPVKGWIDVQNATLAEPEGNAFIDELLGSAPNDWYLGTDNHGQGPDTYAAAGLQIVGQFDYQKSETLARFADGITEAMAEYGVLSELAALREATGADLGPYHWGTLYDMLGYSASGSMIDYYNTADGVDGTGFATELTVGTEVNWLTYPALLNQVWVDSIRAINYTMFRQAVDRKRFTYEVGGNAAYLFDPEVIRHDDANGSGYERQGGEEIPQQPYAVTRMKFFSDLNEYADRRVAKARVKRLLAGDLEGYDSLVIANDALPEPADETAWYAALEQWVEAGGNLILTDAAAQALPKLGLLPEEAVGVDRHYVGFVDFTDRSHPLTAGLRGVARQTYDTVPIGYAFGGEDTAPNWKVDRAAWEAAGGTTLGTNGDDRTIYGELPVGKGRVRFLGALLPDPTEAYYHPYGLQSYAVTYTGYTLLQNMLRHTNPARVPLRCRARKAFRLRVRLPRATKRYRVRVTGAELRRARRAGRRALRLRIGAPKAARVKVRVIARTRGGKRIVRRRAVRVSA